MLICIAFCQCPGSICLSDVTGTKLKTYGQISGFIASLWIIWITIGWSECCYSTVSTRSGGLTSKSSCSFIFTQQKTPTKPFGVTLKSMTYEADLRCPIVGKSSNIQLPNIVGTFKKTWQACDHAGLFTLKGLHGHRPVLSSFGVTTRKALLWWHGSDCKVNSQIIRQFS